MLRRIASGNDGGGGAVAGAAAAVDDVCGACASVDGRRLRRLQSSATVTDGV